jgi:hypothetical protein
MPREGQHHRRIVPAVDVFALACEEAIEQAAQGDVLPIYAQRGQLGCDHYHPALGTLLDLKVWRTELRIYNWLFPVNDPVFSGKPCHEMLWSLEHELPAKMAEADNAVLMRVRIFHAAVEGKLIQVRKRFHRVFLSTGGFNTQQIKVSRVPQSTRLDC